jgi:hydrogenase expression/formation protein HypC
MEVFEIDGQDARVGLGGVVWDIRLDIVDIPPAVGDYVIVHAGFAIHRIDPEEARITLELWREAGMLDEIPE